MSLRDAHPQGNDDFSKQAKCSRQGLVFLLFHVRLENVLLLLWSHERDVKQHIVTLNFAFENPFMPEILTGIIQL